MTAQGHSRRSDGQQGFADVRYAFNGDRICASQRTDAICQEATSAGVTRIAGGGKARADLQNRVSW